MALDLSTDQKRGIILAAITAAGPGADDSVVGSQISRIVGLFEDGSAAMRAFERAEQRAEKTTDTKNFIGEIIFVDKEVSSNRPIIFLRTQVSEHAPEGIELVRLDRLDSPDADIVKALANQATSLVGHKVLVTVAIEKMANANKSRILRSIEDRGAGEADLAGLTVQEGWKLIDWVNGGKDGSFGKIAPKLARLQTYLAAQQPVGV